MATSDQPIASALPVAAPRKLPLWLIPSLFDLLFVSLPLWFFGMSDYGTGLLLYDGDTGWHIRTGDWILQHRQFVTGDIFSFSKPGQPWFAWEWLCDVLFSSLHTALGMKGILLFGIAVAALFCGITFRHMTWRGANLFIALPLALMGFGAATVHLLARPHLWTLLFVAVGGWLIQADLRKPTKWIWTLVPLTILWTNLHGGWLALIAMLGLVAVGKALETFAGNANWTTVRRYLALAAACFAASFLNPYGWHLHRHMFTYLTADWIKDLVSEFSSPSFRSESMLQYEIILLGSVLACGAMLRRREFVGPLLILFWAHSSLVSGRHIPLFVALALPYLADELQRVWTAWSENSKRNSTPRILDGIAKEAQPSLSRLSLWPIVPLVLVASPWLTLPWPKDFSDIRFPVKLVAKHGTLISSGRVFTEDQLADYLIYKLAPTQKVFFDGRSDFYGEELTRQYCRLLEANHDWKQLLERHGFNVALLRPKNPLAAVLKLTPTWRVVEDDGKFVLFAKRGSSVGEFHHSGANEKP
jgi:hypothetical protein